MNTHRTIQTHWNGKMKKLAGLIAGTLGEENKRMKRPVPHYGFGRYVRLFDDGRLEIDRGANEVDVMALMDILTAQGVIEVGSVAIGAEEGDVRADTSETVETAEAEITDLADVRGTGDTENISEEPTECESPNAPEHAEVPESSNVADPSVESQHTESNITPSTNHHFTVSMPRASFTDTALDNLQKLVDSKETLFKKSIGTDSLEVEVTDDVVAFPWFTAKEHAVEQAYTDFITLLCDRARNAKRITAKEREVDNERYAMRGFLLQLGAIGKEYSVMRKVLMDNLSGSAAFRDKKRKSEMAG